MGQSPGIGVQMAHLASLYHLIVLLALFTALAATLANLSCFSGLREARPDPSGPLVSILIPARNEARNIEVCLRSLLSQDHPYCEVVMLDDHSQDATAQIARGLGLSETGSVARLLHGQPLPEGWTGKAWACHQLARAARGEYLFFTDADTTHAHGTVTALLACAKERRADLVSAWPRLVTITWSEKLVLPMLLLLAMMLYPHWLALLLQRFPAVARRLPRKWVRMCGAANGQSIFFRRVAYDRIGGHEAVRDHLVEDVALGRAVAAEIGDGMRLFNCDALRFSTCRMYQSFWEVWEGFTKNIRAAFEGSLAGYLFVAVTQIFCFLLPCVAVLFPVSHRALIVKEVALISLIRLILTVRFRTSWVSWVFHPFGHAIALAIGLNSWRKMNAGGVTWKGRTYQHSAGIP
jgi:chlorobactene glucosyltransferase